MKNKTLLNLLAAAMFVLCTAFTFSSESAFALDPDPITIGAPAPVGVVTCYSVYNNNGSRNWTIYRCGPCTTMTVWSYDAPGTCTP